MALLLSLYGCIIGDNEKKTTSYDSLKKEAKVKNHESDENTDGEKEVKKDEVTIAIFEPYHWGLQLRFPILMTELNKIKEEIGIRVEYDVIRGKSEEEFLKKLNTKLYLDNGPTLIYFYNMPTKIYTESGVALNLEGKIENLDNIYDSIRDKNNYFVPIGMETNFIELNKYESSKMGIEEPDLNWSWDDYITIRDKWLKENGRKLKSRLISETYYHKINEIDIIDMKSKKANINTKEVKDTIKDLRDEFLYGKYEVPNNLKEEDYYKIFFDFNNLTKEEQTKYNNFDSLPLNYIFHYPSENGLYTSTLDNKIRKNKAVLPYTGARGENVYLAGFLVNKNGKNIDNAIKFLNYILSDKTQMKLYADFKKLGSRFYPVNKNIENKIKKVEKNGDFNEKALQLKEYQLEKIKSGEYKTKIVYKDQNMKMFTLRNKLYKDIFKLVFADEEYSDSKLERKLQELENQYNIYLNE